MTHIHGSSLVWDVATYTSLTSNAVCGVSGLCRRGGAANFEVVRPLRSDEFCACAEIRDVGEKRLTRNTHV